MVTAIKLLFIVLSIAITFIITAKVGKRLVSRIMLIGATVLCLLFIPTHYALNVYIKALPQEGLMENPDGNLFEVEKIIGKYAINVKQLTGPLSWRFFKWGIIYGDDSTRFKVLLIDIGVTKNMRRFLDISNPPIAMIVMMLLISSFVASIIERRKEASLKLVNGNENHSRSL